MCYKAIRKWERRNPVQQKSTFKYTLPSDGVTKPKGAYSPAVQEWGWSAKEQTQAFLPSLPPAHKFKISHKALVSSSKHGVTFVRLLSNNLMATLT